MPGAPRPQENGWTSHTDPERRSVVRAFLPLVVSGSLALGAWHLSGDYFAGQARQQAADRWDELRVCLLGDTLKPGDKPSDRVRFIALANHPTPPGGAPWPARCLPYAEKLDEALEARAVVDQVGRLPSSATIVERTSDPAARADLDLLFAELEMADLPLPRHTTMVTPAPGPTKPLFARESLEQLGKVLELDDVAPALDPSTGRVLRVLLPEAQPQACHFNAGSLAERWRSVVCKASPLVVSRDARLGLAPTDAGGLDLISVRDAGESDGIYDAATGLMVLQPRYFDTQAHVGADGRATILFAKLKGESRLEQVDHFRLLQSEPGKRPETRRLKIAPNARLLLLPRDVLWSVPGDAKAGDPLVAQALPEKRSKPLGDKRSLGALPHGSRFITRCADGDTTALLFGAGLEDKRYTLLFQRQGSFSALTDVGTIAGRVTMTCHEQKAMLQRIQHQRVSRWRCTTDGCELGLSDPLPMLAEKVHAVAPVGAQIAVAWKDEAGALRLRVAAPDDLATTPDTVVLDEWQHGGVEMTSLDLVSGGDLAVLFAQDVGRRVYALRIDAKGLPEPVRITR